MNKINNGIEYLPINLADEINSKIINNNTYQYTTKNNFIKCIGLIYYHQNESIHIDYYVPLGSDYWKIVFNHNYHKAVIQPLLDMGIIESKRFDNPNHWNRTNNINDVNQLQLDNNNNNNNNDNK